MERLYNLHVTFCTLPNVQQIKMESWYCKTDFLNRIFGILMKSDFFLVLLVIGNDELYDSFVGNLTIQIIFE